MRSSFSRDRRRGIWLSCAVLSLGSAALSLGCGDEREADGGVRGSPDASAGSDPAQAPAPGGGSGGSASEPVASGGTEGLDPGIGLSPTGAAGAGTPAAGGAVPDAGAAQGAGSSPLPTGPVTVFLAGDSIVQTYAETASDRDQAGWGQMLPLYFDERVTIENRAIGGRTARRFIDEGRLDELLGELEPGSYLLVEFGTNDGNRTATYELDGQSIPYFLEPATDFKEYLDRYIEGARSREALPILVTPTPRNSAYCTGGNGTGAHAAAMRELGQERGVPVVDLNAAAVGYLREICPAPQPEDFFLLRADGTVDGTHFQENGARILAGFVRDGLRNADAALATYLRATP